MGDAGVLKYVRIAICTLPVYLFFTFLLQRHDSDTDKFMITSNHNTMDAVRDICENAAGPVRQFLIRQYGCQDKGGCYEFF